MIYINRLCASQSQSIYLSSRVCGVRAPSRPISLPSRTRHAAPYSAHGVRPRLTVACCYKPSGDYRFCCQWVVTCGGGGSRFGPTRIRAPFPRRAGRRGRRPFAFCFTSYGDAGKSLGSRLKPLRRGSGSVDSDSVFVDARATRGGWSEARCERAGSGHPRDLTWSTKRRATILHQHTS